MQHKKSVFVSSLFFPRIVIKESLLPRLKCQVNGMYLRCAQSMNIHEEASAIDNVAGSFVLCHL